jgi:hypothetical protein
VTDSARERYREWIRRDNPLSRQVDQHRRIEDLLARVAALDAHVAGLICSAHPQRAKEPKTDQIGGSRTWQVLIACATR